MAGKDRIPLFLSPRGEAAKAWCLPVLVRGRRKRRLGLLLAIGLIQSLLTVVVALSVKHAFDQLMGQGQDAASGAITASIALGALALSAILRWREFLIAERLAQGYVHAVRVAVFRHAIRLGEAGLAQTSRSAVLLRFTGDLSAIRVWISRGLSRGLVAMTGIAITLIALLIVDPFIGLAVAASVALTGLFTLALGPALDKATRRVRSRRTRMLRHAQERLSRINIVETLGDAVRERRLLAKKSDDLVAASVDRASIIGILRAAGEAGAAVSSLGAFLVGAVLAGFSLVTPGAVVAAMLLAGLLGPRLHDATRAFEYWTGARVSIEKQQAFLALRPVGRRRGSSASSKRLLHADGRLQLRNVGYRDQIEGVSLALAPGDRRWLPGGSHGEALTLLQLAAGVLQPTKGRVTLDEVSLRDLHRRDTRRHVALVSGDLTLFEGPLREGLTYGMGASHAASLETFIEGNGLTGLIAEFPNGLEHRVQDGDRRITAARCLVFGLIRARLAGARIILIDQADIALGDIETDATDRLLRGFDGAVLWSSQSKVAPSGFHQVAMGQMSFQASGGVLSSLPSRKKH
ncbi:MAG: ABC transporter ATP-binding protein [Hyphomonadaceae bacterium]